MKARLIERIVGERDTWLRAETKTFWNRRIRIAFKAENLGWWRWEDTGEDVGLVAYMALSRLTESDDKRKMSELGLRVHGRYQKDRSDTYRKRLGL